VGAGQGVERALEITVVGQRPAIAAEQRLVVGMREVACSNMATAWVAARWRGAPGHNGCRIGVLGIGAVALAIGLDRAPRIGIGSGTGFDLRGDRSRDIGHGLAAAKADGQNRRQGRGGEKPGKTGLLTHGTLTHGIRRIDRAERAINRPLTLTAG
jgi:hypothetical protein